MRLTAVQRLQPPARNAMAPARLGVDLAIRLPEAGLFLAGRLTDPHRLIDTVTLRSTAGFRHRLDDVWAWTCAADPLADTDDGAILAKVPQIDSAVGFVVLVPAIAARRPSQRYFLEITRRDGESAVEPIHFDDRPPAMLLRAVLDRVEAGDPDIERIIGGHVGPAVRALAAHRPTNLRPLLRLAFGENAGAPRLSAIVPLLEPRGDLDVNLACFTVDPDLSDVEFIVVTRRDDVVPVVAMLRRFGGFYRLRGCVIADETIADTAEAIQLGAREAAADALLVLAPAVYPKEKGWLSRLVQALDALPEDGLVSPTLLYEDNSIRYAGSGAAPEAVRTPPHTAPRFAGYPRSWAADGGTMPTAAASLDCILARRQTLLDLGHFAHRFVGAAWAHADFAMRCRALGRRCYWASGVALYALDGDAEPAASDDAADLVDGWLFAQAWRLAWPLAGRGGSVRR